MIISLLLGKQIAAMLLMVLMGYAVVRLRLLRAARREGWRRCVV